MKVFLHFTKV